MRNRSHVPLTQGFLTVPFLRKGIHGSHAFRCYSAKLPANPTKTALRRLKVVELKEIMKGKGLEVKGKKDELIERLQAYLSSEKDASNVCASEPSLDETSTIEEVPSAETESTPGVQSSPLEKEVLLGGQNPSHAEDLVTAFRNASLSAKSASASTPEIVVDSKEAQKDAPADIPLKQLQVAPEEDEEEVIRANEIALKSTSKLQDALNELEAAKLKEREASQRMENLQEELNKLKEKAESIASVNSELESEMESLKSKLSFADRKIEQTLQAQANNLVVPRVLGAGLGAFGSAFVSAFKRTAMEASSMGSRSLQPSSYTDASLIRNDVDSE